MAVIFGLDQEHEEWLPYPDAPDEEYCIRPLTDELIREWNKQSTRKVWENNYQTRVEKRDDEQYNALLCEQIIGGWRGAVYLAIEDARAGRTSECNLKNKLKFAGTQADRFNWIATVARELGSRVAREIEAQREGFANRIKHNLDFPGLKCSDCREAYQDGELADAEGKMVYQGGCDVALFQCEECPDRLYPLDEISALGQSIWGLLCESLVPDQPPPLQFLFDLMGVQVGSARGREVYQRLLTIRRILEERKALEQGDPATNGHRAEEDE